MLSRPSSRSFIFPRNKGKGRDSLKVAEDRLPFELWSLVCTFLRNDDLTRVARVSSTLLLACRSTLYRSLILRNDSQNLSHVLKVLKIDGLASAVRHATFFTSWTPYTAPATWLDFSLISQFRGLRSLTLIGSPFFHDHEQILFLHTLKPILSLKALTYFPLYPTIFRGESLHIAGLECVSWSIYRNSYLETQAISLLSASAATLTSIALPNFPGNSIQDGSTQFRHPWKKFLSLKFPCLISLSLGLLHSPAYQDTPTFLTHFLIAHPRLQDLFLACSLEPSSRYESITEAGGLVTEDFLPSLRTFETHPANLTLMIRRHVKSLQDLEKLSILYWCNHEIQALVDLVVALGQGSSGFPSLHSLAVQLDGDWVGEKETVEWLLRMGAFCPAVISFTGHIYSLSPFGLAEAFRPYPLLRSIEIPKTKLDTAGSYLTADHFNSVARACPQLSNIVIQPPHQFQPSTCILNRNSDGTLSSVTVIVHD